MFPKFQMPDEILESCTVSYYSRIYGAKGTDRMATIIVWSVLLGQCVQCLYRTVPANCSVFPMYIHVYLLCR